MNDLQIRKAFLESMYEAYRFFENHHKPSGDLMSRIEQFIEVLPKAEPYKMYIYQKVLKER